MEEATRQPFRPSYVYRLFTLSRELLYVGCTRNLTQRLAQHERERGDEWSAVAHMTVEVYADRYVAENIERVAILREKPTWNRLKAHPSPRVRDEEIYPEAGEAPRPAGARPDRVVPQAVETAPAAQAPQRAEREHRTPEQSRQAVFDALAAVSRPVRSGKLAELMDYGQTIVRIRLNELIKEGRVVQLGYNRWTEYRVADGQLLAKPSA